jgi:hypothetical protein
MGRQIHFYMLPEDQSAFLRLAQENDPVTIVLRDADSAVVEPYANIERNDKPLSLWNRKLLPHLEREWIPNPGYYRVNGLRSPTLELIPSFSATWETKPGLGQGRLFGDFDPYLAKPPEFEKWYDRLSRRIRQNYRRNPESTGGYVGPAAYEFYRTGGYLPKLPSAQDKGVACGTRKAAFTSTTVQGSVPPKDMSSVSTPRAC